MKSIYITILLSLFLVSLSYAQQDNSVNAHSAPSEVQNPHFFKDRMDYEIRAFFSIGGSSPLGMPAEIRKINKYSPKFQLGLEANATKWFPDEKWGIRVGAGIAQRGMDTKAQVKNYLTEIIEDDAKVRGYFTGEVETKIQNTYINIPVSAVYNLSENWNLYGGLYASILVSKQFNGTVSSGHFRQGTPVGPKLTFEEGSGAPYDFSNNQRNVLWGAHFGAEWQLKNKHFKLFPQINYSFSNVFQKDFEAIAFSMHNIYLDLGFGYQF